MLRWLVVILPRFGLVDYPGDRRSHAAPTPRGGGVAIYLSVTTMMLLYNYMIGGINITLQHYFISVLLLCIVSFWDDIKPVNAFLRLLIHFIVSYIILHDMMGDVLLLGSIVNEDIDLCIKVFCCVACINIYNFLDGIDGISTIESIHLSVCVIILCYIGISDGVVIPHVKYVLLSAQVLLGASVAFLIFNWHPARIFLGDVGSTLFGLMHGINLMLIASTNMYFFVATFIVSLYYIADGCGTILRRICRLEKLWTPHLNHFFQQAARKGMGHQKICYKIAGINLILMGMGVFALHYPLESLFVSCVAVSILFTHFSHEYIKTSN
jgi:UDP-N-acetylmuramyl pentapeptide phosphotransferase/UDP-N-acetylglucosamine-1-phosphate transferase